MSSGTTPIKRETKIGPYEEEQLEDALVVDSAGFICGRVKEIEILEDRVLLRLYKEVEEKVVEVDIRELKIRLLETLGRGFLSWFSPMTYEKLCKKVRKALKLEKEAPVEDKHLVEFAKLMGIELPTREVIRRREEAIPDPVDFNLVSAVGITELGTCILLSKPVEASRRGIQVPEKPPYITTEEAEGRMVITCDAKIVGLAREVLVGRPMALKISIGHYEEHEVRDVSLLIERLVPDVYPTEERLFREIARRLQLESLEISENEIKEWAKLEGYEIPVRKEKKWVEEREMNISWDDIAAIGDVILLKLSGDQLLKRS